jgi:hypothetical protein
MSLYLDEFRSVRMKCDGCGLDDWVRSGIVSAYWHIEDDTHQYCGECWDRIKQDAKVFGDQCSFPLFEPAIRERLFFRCVEANNLSVQCSPPAWGYGAPRASVYVVNLDNRIELRGPR